MYQSSFSITQNSQFYCFVTATISVMIQEILPHNWNLPFDTWFREYLRLNPHLNENTKMQTGSKSLYTQMFKNYVYKEIIQAYCKYGDYPKITIRNKYILACILKETRSDMTVPFVQQNFMNPHDKTDPDMSFEQYNTSWLKETHFSGEDERTVFEILLIFYAHWLFFTSPRAGEYIPTVHFQVAIKLNFSSFPHKNSIFLHFHCFTHSKQKSNFCSFSDINSILTL